MSDEELEPLSGRMREVIEASSEMPPLPGDVHERLRRRMAALAPVTAIAKPDLSSGVGGAGGATLAAASSAKVIFAAIIGLAVGATAGVWITKSTMPPEIVRVEVPVYIERSAIPRSEPQPPVVIAPDASTVSEPAPRPVPLERPVERPSRTPDTREEPPSARTTLEEERTLIDAARAALRHGDAMAAIEALDRHAERFPRGELIEEREGLRVISLVRSDPARASEQAARFQRRYPRSILLPAIHRALAGASSHEPR